MEKKMPLIPFHHIIYKPYNLLCLVSYILFIYTSGCVSVPKNETEKPSFTQQRKTTDEHDQMLGNIQQEGKVSLFKPYGEIPKGKALVYIYYSIPKKWGKPTVTLSVVSLEFLLKSQIEEGMNGLFFPISDKGDSYEEIYLQELAKVRRGSYLPYAVEPGAVIFGIHLATPGGRKSWERYAVLEVTEGEIYYLKLDLKAIWYDYYIYFAQVSGETGEIEIQDCKLLRELTSTGMKKLKVTDPIIQKVLRDVKYNSAKED